MGKTCKYYKRQKFVSYNDGETWQPVEEFARGALIETDSPDCGAITTYRWYPSGYTCIGCNKWNRSIYQVSFDNGSTWSNVQPEQYTATTINEYNSSGCCEPVEMFKIKATYTGGTTYSAECDTNSSLTLGDTYPNGYTHSAMTTAIIGDCIISINECVFQDCYSLTSVTIPDSVTFIGGGAFIRCSGLTSVTIPDSVTSIENSSFSLCTSLTSCTIGSGVTSIHTYAFRRCSGLTSITIPNEVTNIEQYAFYDCNGLTSVTIPSSVTSIGDSSFSRCSGLTSMSIGSGVTSIGNNAFSNCSSLTSITINTSTPPSIGINVFYATNDCPIYVPSGSVNAYKSAWSEYSSRIQAIP